MLIFYPVLKIEDYHIIIDENLFPQIFLQYKGKFFYPAKIFTYTGYVYGNLMTLVNLCLFLFCLQATCMLLVPSLLQYRTIEWWERGEVGTVYLKSSSKETFHQDYLKYSS